MGDGSFSCYSFYSLGEDGYSLVAADFDGNGSIDIAAALDSSQVAILFNQTSAGCLLGDINMDSNVDLLDVASFVSLIVSGNFQCEGDMNQDGTVDFLDISPFVEALTGG